MVRPHWRKWSTRSILVELADDIEVVEAPIYKSTGGPLFKTLLSSGCRMDCRYCPVSRICRSAIRERWDPGKLVRVFLEAHQQGLVRGLFLSSGLYGDPETVVEEMIGVVEVLRKRGYQGYVHVRLMPGTPRSLIRYALELVDRVGLNLEAPGPSFFAEIAPSKGSWSLDLYSRLVYAAAIARNPRRVDTQLVVGASSETDYDILRLVEDLVSKGVGRIHFSPFHPYPGTPMETHPPTPPRRAWRLYEAWALLARYGMRLRDLEPVLDDNKILPITNRTLKEHVALAHPEWYPVDPDTATARELARVPGIGPVTARRIVAMREEYGTLTPDLLLRLLGPKRYQRAAPWLALPRRTLLDAYTPH